jgi:hypothetical protein
MNIREVKEDVKVLQPSDDFGGQTSHDCVHDNESTIDTASYRSEARPYYGEGCAYYT